MRRRSLLAATLAAPAFAAQAQARPIRLVVPFPPGGTVDLLGRLVAPELESRLGQTVVVENRPGAGGMIGSDAVAKAPPDGTALVISNIASHGVGAAVNRAMPYDPLRDFTHIGLIAAVPSALASRRRGGSPRSRSSSMRHAPHPARCASVPPATAPQGTPRPRCWRAPRASNSRMCPIAAPHLP